METDRNPDTYEFTRLVFGSTCSPFLAQLVAKCNANRYKKQFERASESVLLSTYMDDTLDSVDTVMEAIKLYFDINKLWDKAGMQSHKWLTNSLELLQHIPEEKRGVKLDISDNRNESTKALGIRWDHQADMLTFCAHHVEMTKLTKRSFLQCMASIFDPLGMLCPFVLEAKCIIQSMWINSMDWDEEISGKLKIAAENWLLQLKDLDKFKIPRCLCPYKNCDQLSIHAFCDASEVAYGTVIYIRYVIKGLVKCNFVLAKCRVAPINSLSVPRLELLSAVKGTEMAVQVAKAMKISASGLTVLMFLGGLRIGQRYLGHSLGIKLAKFTKCRHQISGDISHWRLTRQIC